jgi:neutral ceramidase
VLGGYGVSFPFTTVDAPLRAKALALQWREEKPVVIVSVDTLKLREASIGPVRAHLARRLGVPERRFIFVATHTHAAPMLPGHYGHSDPFLEGFLEPELLKKREEYLATLQEALVTVCLRAFSSRSPVDLEFGSGSANFAVNRRVKNPDGSVSIGENRSAPVDHSVPIVVFRGRDHAARAIAFGYPCHGTTVGPQVVSPDYMGYAEAELQACVPGALALFFPGFGADVNPSPWFRDVDPYPASDGGVANAKAHGAELARAALNVLQNGGLRLTGPLLFRSGDVELPLNTPPPGQSQLIEELEAASSDTRFGPRRVARARAHLNMHARGMSLPTHVSVPISYLDLGQAAVLFMGGEVVSDYAFRLKQLINQPLWTVAYAHDCPAYIPSARMIEEGGYEPHGSMVNNGWFGPFDPRAEEMVIDAALELAGAKRP